MLLPFKCISEKVGMTVTSLEVENSILSSALRSIPSAMIAVVLYEKWVCMWC